MKRTRTAVQPLKLWHVDQQFMRMICPERFWDCCISRMRVRADPCGTVIELLQNSCKYCLTLNPEPFKSSACNPMAPSLVPTPMSQ